MPTPPTEISARRLRLDFLDGLRGLAALWVMLFHVAIELSKHSATLAGTEKYWYSAGHQAVGIFIVLSGYCLMLPVARGDGHLSGGLWTYIKRRATRILPPYYAALVLALGITVFVQRDALSAGAVLSHLFLVQNLSMDWAQQIDGPMWSVATEWQIYFVFGLLLLPLWRRLGPAVTVAVALLLSLVLYRLYGHQLEWTCPHMIVLFVFGMIGASVNFARRPQGRMIDLLQKTRIPWPIIAGLLFLSAWVVDVRIPKRMHPEWVVLGDFWVGVAATALIVACTRRQQSGENPSLVLRVLSGRAPVVLGTFSYSLYLIHLPLLFVVFTFLQSRHVSDLTYIADVSLSVPGVAALCYGFHLLFERPFMPGHPKTERQAEQSAIVSPAP